MTGRVRALGTVINACSPCLLPYTLVNTHRYCLLLRITRKNCRIDNAEVCLYLAIAGIFFVPPFVNGSKTAGFRIGKSPCVA